MFVKGTSGNPNGRPKIDFEVRAEAKRHAQKAIDTILKLLDSKDERVSLNAAQAILDRGYGKPAQSVEVTGSEESPLHTVIERRIVHVNAKD